MKHLKKILALLLVCCLCLCLLAACASEEQTKTPDPAPTDVDDTPEQPDAEGEGEPEEIAEIEFYYLNFRSADDATMAAISDAVNTITEPEIGVHVNLHMLDLATYTQQVPMAITGGETVDLCSAVVVPPVTYAGMLSSGQLKDISGLLDAEAPELKALLGDLLDAYSLNGGIYGVPTYRNYNSTYYVSMRTDVLQELGMEEFAQNMSSWSEYEQIMAAVKQARPDLWPIGNYKMIFPTSINLAFHGDSWTDISLHDPVGDSLGLVAANGDGSGEVFSIFDEPDDSFRWACQRAAEWYENGWVYPDCAITEQNGDQMLSSVTFSEISSGEIGMDTRVGNIAGCDITSIPVKSQMVTTSTVTGWGMVVPVTAQEPEAAVRFLNLMYTNKELMTILDWGIEGEHYEVLETGEVAYPNGATESAYHVDDFIFGNAFLIAPWSGNGSDYRDRCLQENENATYSPYMGFGLDTSELSDLIAALTSVSEEYRVTLVCGQYTDELYADFQSKLEVSGLAEYQAAIQSQLSAWMDAN